MAAETRVVRIGSADEAALGDGWTNMYTSWGARLRLAPAVDERPFRNAVHRAVGAGVEVRELSRDEASGLLHLERANHADYPGGPATAAPDLDERSVLRLWDRGRVFGAVAGSRLVAVTAVRRESDRAETDFTSVLAAFRGRGMATAVKGGVDPGVRRRWRPRLRDRWSGRERGESPDE